MKTNTETTVFQKLCVVIGSLLAFAGIVTIVIVGSFSAYSNTTILLIGFVLLIAGVLIARTRAIIDFVANNASH